MNRLINTAVKTAMLFSLLIIATGSIVAQSPGTTKAAATNIASAATPQTVNAQQSGPWTVGIDAAKNSVRIANTDAEPVTVKLVGTGAGRKPFQFRLSANAGQGEGGGSAYFGIPAGKRLVIENVSAIGRTGPGLRMLLDFFCYTDNGDGVGDASDITFHRITLTDQGTFVGLQTSTANHKVLIFADERIGTEHFGLTLQMRLDGPGVGSTNQGQVTFSGYMEDLPTP